MLALKDLLCVVTLNQCIKSAHSFFLCIKWKMYLSLSVGALKYELVDMIFCYYDLICYNEFALN